MRAHSGLSRRPDKGKTGDKTDNKTDKTNDETAINKTMTTANWKNLTTTSCFAAGGDVAAQYLCADHMVRIAAGGNGSSG